MGNICKHDQEKYHRLLDDITDDYCKPSCYCILKELLAATQPSRRMLVQMRIIDRIKYERSKNGGDVGWEGALKVWVDEGWAERFTATYSDDKSHKTIYAEIFKHT